MLKKAIALTLIFALLAPMSSALAIEQEAPTPTIEEILNSYHEKSMESYATGISLCSTGSTLEEETVDILNNAGYEAYHVTSDNYDSLEEKLQTDFASMGLSKDSSYILALGVQEPNTSTYGFPSNTEEDIIDGVGPSFPTSFFYYTYNGTQYKMRYITLTSTSHSAKMLVAKNVNNTENFLSKLSTNIFDTVLVSSIDAASGIPLGTVASLLSNSLSPDNVIELSPNELTLMTSTLWTSSLIQVYYDSTSSWDTAQCSDYTLSMAHFTGYIYDSSKNEQFSYTGDEYIFTHHSSDYYNRTKREADAMKAFDQYSIYMDYVKTVKFYLAAVDADTDGTDTGDKYTVNGNSGVLACIHERSYSLPLHSFD